jgi:hypothetical protein
MVISSTIDNLTVKDKRFIFHCLREYKCTPDTFMPAFGFTTAEFAVWQILGDGRKSRSISSTADSDK